MKSEKKFENIKRKAPLKKAGSLSQRPLKPLSFYAKTHFKDLLVDRCEELNEQELRYKNGKILNELIIDCKSLGNKFETGFRLDASIKTLIEMIDESLQVLKDEHDQNYLQLLQKPGRTRTDSEICSIVLTALDFCETYEVDDDWIREFLLPGNRLYHAIQVVYDDVKISLPIPSSVNPDRGWQYSLKETFQRSLFSPATGKVKKKKDKDYCYESDKFYSKIKKENLELFKHMCDDQINRYDPDWNWEEPIEDDIENEDYLVNFWTRNS